MALRPSRRLTIGIVTLVAAGVASVWLAREPPSPPPPGALLYELRCSGCHDVRDVAAMVQAAGDRQARRRRLETLLATHTVSTSDENRIIIDYLLVKDPGSPATE